MSLGIRKRRRTIPPPPVPPASNFRPSGVWGAGVTNVVAPARDSVHGAAAGGTNGLVLSGSDVASMHRSTDNGLTWVPSFQGMDNTEQKSAAIAWSETTAGRVFAYCSRGLSGTGWIMRSNDYGVTWSVLNATIEGTVTGGDTYARGVGTLLALDEANDRIYVGTRTGIKQIIISTGAVSDLVLTGQSISSIVKDSVDGTASTYWATVTQERAFTVNAGTDTLTVSGGHSYANGDKARLKTTTTLPGGLAASTTYYVRDSNTGAGTLKLAATSGGAAIDITSAGSGTHLIASGPAGLHKVTSMRSSPVASRVYEPVSMTAYDCAAVSESGTVKVYLACGTSGVVRYDSSTGGTSVAEYSFDAGTNGATITTSDTGNGTAFNAVNIPAGGSLTYDNSLSVTGGQSGKFISGTAASTTFGQWSTAIGTQTTIYARFWVRMSALPSANLILFRTRNVTANAANVRLSATNKFELTDSAGAAGGVASTASMPVDRWVRVEVDIVYSATVGSITCRLYNLSGTDDPLTSTVGETVSRTNINTNTAATEYSLGLLTNTTAFTANFDGWAISLTGTPGSGGGAGVDITNGLTTQASAIDAARISSNTATLVLVGQSNTGGSSLPKLAWTSNGHTATPTWTSVSTGTASIKVGGSTGPDHWKMKTGEEAYYALTGTTADVTAVAIDPNDPDRWFAAERTSVWRKQPSTTVWYPVTEGLCTDTSLGAAVDPTNSAQVAFLSVDWTVVRSKDRFVTQPISPTKRPSASGGTSPWQRGFSGSFHPDGSFLLGCGERNDLAGCAAYFAATPFPIDNTVYPWTDLNLTAPNRCTGVCLGDDGAGTKVYLAYSQASGIWRKVGAGAWSNVQSTSGDSSNSNHDAPFCWPLVSGSPGANVYCIVPDGTTNGGLWRSTDRGANWTKLTSFTVSSRYVGRLVYRPATPTTLYYTRDGASAGLWRATSASGTPTFTNITPAGMGAPGALAVHPSTGLLYVAQLASGSGGTKLWSAADDTTFTEVSDAVWRGAAGFVHGMAVGSDGSVYGACHTGGYVVR